MTFSEIEALAYLLRIGPMGSAFIGRRHRVTLERLGLIRSLGSHWALTPRGCAWRERLTGVLESLAGAEP